MGPLTTTIAAKDVVEPRKAGWSVEAIARITGKCSGLAPAMTALIATFSTVYACGAALSVMDIAPTF
jgi:hypothetical protein